ncbi:hypothetical protein HZB94_02505 [Candidatus Falkowbacteria bacterium]|nr:hypothetical protein [Candidatus Falkowbacteria bacterium]
MVRRSSINIQNKGNEMEAVVMFVGMFCGMILGLGICAAGAAIIRGVKE